MSCSICFNKIDKEHKLDCGHVFHECCIEKWISINASCPICRYHISFSVDKFVKLINQINELTGYKVKYQYNKVTLIATRKNYDELVKLKNNMVIYNFIRMKGFSADFLASTIGYDIIEINTKFNKMIIH